MVPPKSRQRARAKKIDYSLKKEGLSSRNIDDRLKGILEKLKQPLFWLATDLETAVPKATLQRWLCV
jgi:hypothetical protein